MEKFITLEAKAAALDLVNIDTDMIIAKQFLKTIKRTGLGKNLFHEMRYDINDVEIDDFILNKPSHKDSQILISGSNFGCGSSREHAPWALFDFGIKCVIASSFADIFYNNCFKNGILPIALEQNQVKELMNLANDPENNFNINLPNQEIRAGNKTYKFNIDQFRKHCLIEGLDDIGLTLQKKEKINIFEKNNQQKLSWLYS
ncbi:MAG: 3-isopropylmalate/(R)-2-methylmalate dehydratase small subunit [Rickettsiales bacterium]|jgi:3-isopropylmalate/(R)-2-methylmalate dehydratase small subunit